jgi:hypothetical protein
VIHRKLLPNSTRRVSIPPVHLCADHDYHDRLYAKQERDILDPYRQGPSSGFDRAGDSRYGYFSLWMFPILEGATLSK